MTQRIRVHIQGIVQGVGFRPFIYQLAHRHRLNGYVTNTPKGVELEVEGGRDALNHFLKELPESAPPLASITQIETEELPAAAYSTFEIKASEERSEERRVGKDYSRVDLGGRRIIKKTFFFQAEDGIRDGLG